MQKSVQKKSALRWTLASGARGVVDAVNKFTWTADVRWRKGTAWPVSE